MNFRGFLSFILIVFIILFVAFLLFIKISRDKVVKILQNYIKFCFKLLQIKIRIFGADNIDISKSYVFISNHSSLIDIAVLKIVLPINTYFVAKKELFKIPILSFALKKLFVISIDRQHRDKAVKSLDSVLNILSSNKGSIWLAPEGTRNIDGDLLPFKKGAFLTAFKAKVPVLPISLCGTWNIMKKRSFKLYKGNIDVYINKPVKIDDLSSLDNIIYSSRDIIYNDIKKYKETNV